MNDKQKFNPSDFTQDLETKTNAEINLELESLLMEEKRLDLELKREQVSKIRAHREAVLNENRAKTLSTLQFLAQRASQQKICNHRKGGRGADAIMRGRGDDASYAVIHHILPAGGIMVLCQRCGAEWHPRNDWNIENGKRVPLPATEGYETAINWNTDNSPSGSSRFLFTEA